MRQLKMTLTVIVKQDIIKEAKLESSFGADDLAQLMAASVQKIIEKQITTENFWLPYFMYENTIYPFAACEIYIKTKENAEPTLMYKPSIDLDVAAFRNIMINGPHRNMFN